MKTKKVSFANIAGLLSRDEMKKIMAGSGTNCKVRCDQNSSTEESIKNCDKETVKDKCGSTDKAVCYCD